jgi:hypothetical protein
MNIVPNQTPIKIFSRQAIEKACAENPFAPVAIISITDVSEPLANIPANYNIRCCLRLQFDDVFVDEDNAICQADADDIAQFAYDIYDSHLIEADEIWIHCEGGVSRSAAVAAAISKHFFGDDMWVFSNPAYYPNMWVNKLVIEALGDEWDYKEFIRKLNVNIQNYKERENSDV